VPKLLAAAAAVVVVVVVVAVVDVRNRQNMLPTHFWISVHVDHRGEENTLVVEVVGREDVGSKEEYAAPYRRS